MGYEQGYWGPLRTQGIAEVQAASLMSGRHFPLLVHIVAVDMDDEPWRGLTDPEGFTTSWYVVRDGFDLPHEEHQDWPQTIVDSIGFTPEEWAEIGEED